MVNCSNLIIKMSPRFVLGRENVPSVAEVVNRSLKADCTDFRALDLSLLEDDEFSCQGIVLARRFWDRMRSRTLLLSATSHLCVKRERPLIITYSLYSRNITHFFRIRDGVGEGRSPSPTNSFWRTKLTPTNYISLEREFIGESDSFSISTKYFDFAILWTIFAKLSKFRQFSGDRKNFALCRNVYALSFLLKAR